MSDETILKESILQFQNRWTVDSIKSMTLTEYTTSGGKDTFTYWLEAKSDDIIGIWGGSAYKFGIFNRDPNSNSTNDRDRLSTDGEYSWYTKYGTNKEEVFIKIRKIILEIIENAQKKNFEEIDKFDLGTAVKWKIAYIYAPYNSLLRFVSDKALNHLHEKYFNKKEKSIAKINEKLLSLKPKELSVVEYSEKLWTEYKSDEAENKIKYWLYSPGASASKWDEFYQNGMMALGWDELGDLSQYKSKDEIRDAFYLIENTDSDRKNDVVANYDFIYNLQIGDIVIAKRGQSKYLGYGIVKSKYIFDNERESYKSIRRVKWIKKGIWEEESKNIVVKTFTEITKYKDYVVKLIDMMGIDMVDNDWKEREKAFKDWAIHTVKRPSSIDGYIRNSMNKKIPEKLIEIGEKDNNFVSLFQITEINELETLSNRLLKDDLMNFNKNVNNREPSAAVNKYISFLKGSMNGSFTNTEINDSLNVILYGPPGTGKTYHTINKAIEIIENRKLSLEEEKDRDKLKESFKEYKRDGQIEFVTFHQSYGYEEFVEGIKALPSGSEGNEDGEEMIYDVMPGIFKKLSKKAQDSKTIPINNKSKEFTLNAPQLNIQAKMIQDDENSFRVLAGSKIRKDHSNTFKLQNLKTKILNTIKNIEEDEWFLMEEDYTFKSMSGSSSIVLGRASNGFKEWKEVKENNLEIDDNSEHKNYVLIIDEINRGNISKIFGELITLIEDSKRAGNEEQVEIILPYSGEPFSVPNNLYIIGTMNTADRSIALMDTALRRRFHFEEMMPDTKLLDFEVEGINIKSMVDTINQRIEYLYDRDHMIGHAYFIDLEKSPVLVKLENIFRNKVIPLLQEYFYDDWEKIQMILGDHYDQIENNKNHTGKDYSSYENEKNKIRFIQSIKVNKIDILGFEYDEIDDEGNDYRVNPILFPIDAYKKLC